LEDRLLKFENSSQRLKLTAQTPRWKQRLVNFSQARGRLQEAYDLAQQRALSDLEKQGLIQAFEFTHELAWKLLKDYFDYQGASLISGSRDATREAIQKGLINHGDDWMEMIKSRNQTSHTYNLNVANEIAEKILSIYCARFSELYKTMSALK